MSAPEIVRVANVDAIIAFAQKLPVFPCARSTKKPLVIKDREGNHVFGPEHGCNSATRDADTISAWWGEWPDALVGVPMGAASGGLVAIDFDEYKQHPASANWMQEHTAQLMSARIHRTVRGGKHYLFKTGQRVKSVNGPTLGGLKRDAIDIKAEGGYIIWWPFHGGEIVQGEGDFPPLPVGLLEDVFHVEHSKPARQATTSAKWREDRGLLVAALSHIPASIDRNEWRNTGFELHHHSGGSEDGFQLFHLWSMGALTGEDSPAGYEGEADCRKLWDHANVSRGTSAVRGIGGLFVRAQRYGYRQPSKRDQQAARPPLPGLDFDNETGVVFNADSVKEGARERRRQQQERPALPADIEIDEAPSIGAVMGETVEERPWLFESYIPAGAFLIVARPKLGKSWWSLQLCMHAAAGADFLSFKSLGPVGSLYFCSEDDHARIQSRVRSMDLPFDLARLPMKLLARENLERYAQKYAGQMTFAQFLDMYLEKYPQIKLVIIDTESVCMRVWDGENAGSQERSVTKKDYADVDTFSKIALRRGVFIGLVNHTRKARSNSQGFEDPHEMINRTNTANAGAAGSFVFDQPTRLPEQANAGKVLRMSVRGRDVLGDHEFAVEQVKGGAFEFRGAWDEYSASAAEAEALDALIEIQLDSPSEWHTAKDVAEWLGKNVEAVRKVFQRMVRKDGQNPAPRSYRGWRVTVKRGKGVSISKIEPTG